MSHVLQETAKRLFQPNNIKPAKSEGVLNPGAMISNVLAYGLRVFGQEECPCVWEFFWGLGG